MTREHLFASCTPGLEPALAEELADEGLTPRLEPGGTTVDAPAGAHQQLNLYLRSASRVLLRVGDVASAGELGRLSLAPFRAAGGAVELHVTGERAAGWERDATRAWGLGGAGRGPKPEARGSLGVYLRGEGGRCTVSVDTTGELLHFRGYRQEVGRAPLRETLAAGVLRLAKWRPDEPLWDVMCGSGTILIEAAERALGLAAGRNRHFAFEAFPSFDAGRFAALPRQRAAVTPSLFGSDLNAGALGTARRNARRAGVELRLERLDATKLQPRPGAPGLVIANLPYGKRVGEKGELGALYRGLGASLRRACPGWRFAFLLEEGAERLGLPIDWRAKVSNGGLRCELVGGRIA